MTKSQFRKAVAENNFRQVLMWLEDTTGKTGVTGTGTSYGLVINRATGKVMRRASLARAIQLREKHIKELADERA
jgi:hypothetical protein